MKAISVRHPHAGRIKDRIKTIETRSRPIPKKYIGVDLLICASKSPVVTPWRAGVAQCVVKVVECRRMTPEDSKAAMVPHKEGMWSWVLEYVRSVEPMPVKGVLGIYDVEI